MRFVARQRNEFTRAIYAAEVALYDPGMFIFLDETGSDRRNVLRKYGYSFRGIPVVSHKLLVRGQHLSTIACISIHGLLEFETVECSVDDNTFYQFVCKKLLPLLLPFDGVNHHSIVVVMDNASVHHVDGISDLISTAGSLLINLPPPPYSPDYNPIEEAFSKFTQFLEFFFMRRSVALQGEIVLMVLCGLSFGGVVRELITTEF
uniref:Tc1-like transposase DDE domain-containing protein n=1 Tax=Amphimedon queenslandica TaxID=400682 RepID=A0A1X7V9X1_AMPQE